MQDMLADATPTPNELHSFMVTGMFLVNAIASVLLFFKMSRNDPQKREVSFAESYASREQMSALENELGRVEQKLDGAVEAIRAEMKQDRQLLHAAGEERAVKLHDRINQVLAAVSEVRGEIKHLNQ